MEKAATKDDKLPVHRNDQFNLHLYDVSDEEISQTWIRNKIKANQMFL